MNLNFSPSFMEVYDNALTKKECELLISQFEKSPKREGSVIRDGHHIVDKNLKNSVELSNCFFSQSTPISSIISTSLNRCFDKYKKKHSIFSDYLLGIECFDGYTFKKFEGKDGGYKIWHCEHGSGDDNSKRILVWSFYLNDAEGTEFRYYPNVRAKMGRCLIFPASFNYMHRSAPNKGIKYFVSGWISHV